MDAQTKEELSEFLADELHRKHLNGYWFDGEDVLILIDKFIEKKSNSPKEKLKKVNQELEDEMDKLTNRIASFGKTVKEL